VVLPKALLKQLDAAALETVLAHELAHVRRKDHWIRLLELVVTTLFWWHPVVWWASHELRELEEQCCDGLVLVTVPHGARVYATALLDTLDCLSERSVSTPGVATAAKSAVSLARRIKMLKNRPDAVPLTVGRPWLLLVVAAIPMGLALAAKPPQTDAPSRSDRQESPEQSVNRNREQGQAKNSLAAQDFRNSATDRPPTAKPVETTLSFSPQNFRPTAGKNFLIVPFATDLQRAMRWDYGNAQLLILINGMALLNDHNTVLDLSALDYEGLQEAIQAYRRAGLREGREIIQVIGVPLRDEDDDRFPWEASILLHSFLDRQHSDGTNEGNQINMQLRNPKHPQDWDRLVSDLITRPTEEAIRRESGVGDNLVKVYPICTPLSRYFTSDVENCVIANVKPLDQLTPDEIQAFPEKVKTYLARLNLQEPPTARFVMSYGVTSSKGNRAKRKLDQGFEAHSLKTYGQTLWNAGRSHTTPFLLIRVVGEDDNLVKDVKITADIPERPEKTVRFTERDDGRWRSSGLVGHEDFNLTVEAPGYKRTSQEFNMPWDTTKEMEVKLQKE